MSTPPDENPPLQKLILPRIFTGTFGLLVFAAAWFGIAGRLAWWRGWAFLITFIVYVTILMGRLWKLNPDLVRERYRPAAAARAWDRVIMGVYAVILMILMLVCALDGGRYHWSTVPLGVQIIGWILLLTASAMIWHVMMTNAYLSSWARIQDDRGQVVVQEGLYAMIRHPMYLGVIAGFLGLPLLIGSWWAIIPSVLIAGLFVYRTWREDRMLIDDLAGYVEYTSKVRYRLIPGIW